jgi:hypothetical protein
MPEAPARRAAAVLLLLALLLPALPASAAGSRREGSQPPPPTVASCRPAQGRPGARVTIAGSGFRAGARVELGGAAATGVVVVSDREIVATAGPHKPGRVSVTVTNSNGQTGSRGLTFRYLPP